MSPSPGNGRLSPAPRPGPSHHASSGLRLGRRSRDSSESGSRSTQHANANGPGTLDLTSLRHKASDSPLGAADLDDARPRTRGYGSGRRKRPESSGGFLLDNAFEKARERASPRNGHRPVSREDRSPAPHGSNKGKGKANIAGANGNVRRPAPRSDRSASPMYLSADDSRPGNGTQPSFGTPRISVEASDGSTGPWLDDGHYSGEGDDGRWHQPIAQPAAVDSAQLVQMALALSESRRRHASIAHLTPPPATAGRRATSANGPTLQGLNGLNAGGSLKRYLNEQRRISSNVSPSLGRATPSNRHASAAFSTIGPLDIGIGQPRLNISDGTSARVEKAKAYIEMRSQYMRLLGHLPPLKPDSKADGNTVVRTTSGPGGTVHMSRTPSHLKRKQELGRPYNPLQAVRDRKLRARLRKPCNPDAVQWADLDSVIDWVEVVEENASRSTYRAGDRVRLPQFFEGESSSQRVASGHSRTESSTAGKAKKASTDWHVSPEELFADAYWLEQGGHKGLVEDRHGNILFPEYDASEPAVLESPTQEQPPSAETQDALMSVESMANGESMESTDVDSPEPIQVRGRRRLFHRNREQSPGTLRQLWQKRKDRSPSSDGLSETDDEYVDGRPRAKRRHPPVNGANIGPLERHMNSIIDNLDQTGSPEIISPGTPRKWGEEHDALRSGHQEGKGALTPGQMPERKSPQMLVHGDRANRKRPFPALETAFDSSLDESAPNSPVAPKKAPSVTMNDPQSRDSSRAPGQKRRIPFLHHRTKDGARLAPHDPYTEGDGDTRGSRQPSAETDPRRSSLDDRQKRPQPQSTQWRTNEGLASSAGSRKEGNEKEPSSAVSRFFKGGRVGDIIRGERPDFTWKRETLPEEVPSSSRSSNYESESAGEDTRGRARNGLSQTTTNTSWASRALDRRSTNKPRYHIEGLPTFKSSTSQPQSTSALQNAIDKARPSRFNLIPSIRTGPSELSRVSTREDGSQSTHGTDPNTGSFYADDRRGSYGFLDPRYRKRNSVAQLSNGQLAVRDPPNGTNRGGLSTTSLRDTSRGTSPSPGRRALPDGHRHWSISDAGNLALQRSRSSAGARSSSRPAQAPSQPSCSVVSKVDIERVRALLLCTGIKAHTMSDRASSIRAPDEVDWSLRRAAAATGRPLVPVPRKQEHVLAARMLVDDFEASVERLRELAGGFASAGAPALAAGLDRLKELARDELSERSRRLGDEAGGIAIRVTTKGTRDVQAISEAAQALARARRRRMRWVRRVGWGTVEWLLLGLMWWVWLIVVVIRMGLTVLGGVVCAVKWLFFL